MNNLFLVKYKDNWADEIDVEGCQVMTENEFHNYFNAAKKAFNECNCINFYIGSNESIEYENYEDFIKSIQIINISKDAYEVLQKFNLYDYGIFPRWIFDDYYEEE